MYKFHAILRAGGADIPVGPTVEISGREYGTLDPATDQLSRPFPLSFEAAADAMDRLNRMIIEPDGSFVLTGSEPEPWQVEGNLFDRADHLLYVECWGHCPPHDFDRLLSCFGWPAVTMLFQCNRTAACLDEPEFRRLASES